MFKSLGEQYAWAAPEIVRGLSFAQIANYMGWQSTGKHGSNMRLPAAEAIKFSQSLKQPQNSES